MESPSSPEPLSPFQELLMRAAAGSREAVGKLLLKFVPQLRKLAGHRLPPHIQGKISPSDLVQDVIVTAMEKFPQFEGTTEESLRAWLCMMLLNKLAKWRHRFFAALRDVRHEMSLDAPAADEVAWQQLADPGLPPDEIAARNEMAEVIREALAQLEEEHQLILRLRSETNLSYKEIGEVLDCTAAAARSHYYRACELLEAECRKALGRQRRRAIPPRAEP